MSPAALEKMEDTKPLDETVNNSHSDSTNLDPSEARFAEFCKNGLSMDENTCTQSMKLFKETKHLLQTNISAIGNGTLDEAERFWFAFVLYSIKRLSEKNGDSEQQGSDDNGFTLCQILRAAKLNIVDFFKELPQFVVKAGPILSNLYGADWENRLEAKELQANFVHLSLLSKWPSMISLLERNKTASCSHHFNQIVNHQLPQLLERCKGWNRF